MQRVRRDIKALYWGERFARCSQREGLMRVWSVHQKVINLEVGDELLALALPQAGGSSRFLTLNALPDLAQGDSLQLTRTALCVTKTGDEGEFRSYFAKRCLVSSFQLRNSLLQEYDQNNTSSSKAQTVLAPESFHGAPAKYTERSEGLCGERSNREACETIGFADCEAKAKRIATTAISSGNPETLSRPLSCFIDFQRIPLWQGPLPIDARAVLTPKRFAAFTEAVEHLDIEPPVSVLVALTPETVDRWIGLGPGLTPAGDDVVLGYLAADNHLGQDSSWTEAMHKAVARTLGRTTRLSAQLLKNALAYEYHESIQRVIAILCGSSKENLLSALRRLTRVGASSGKSMVYGMQLALKQRDGAAEQGDVSTRGRMFCAVVNHSTKHPSPCANVPLFQSVPLCS